MSFSRLITLGVLICTGYTGSSSAASYSTKPTNQLEIAKRFAPVFFQALGDSPRSDYITKFDFDGDWRGDNNWENAGKTEFPLQAYIYYSVAETATHFFIHYAVFHPRDYKGGERRGPILSELIREGIKHGAKYDPTGLAEDATLAHENDMEGALVVVQKNGKELRGAQVVYVETLRHNNFAKYQAGETQSGFSSITIENQRPLLYIEPKGHGIEAFTGEQKQIEGKDFLRYVEGGSADDPDKKDSVCRNLQASPCDKSVNYELISLSVLWAKAKNENDTFGATFDYGEIKLSLNLAGRAVSQKTFRLGTMGCAFLGSVGGINMARPPWGWFDRDERNVPLGQWFFDPATTIKKDFQIGSSYSTTYTKLPFWAVSE